MEEDSNVNFIPEEIMNNDNHSDDFAPRRVPIQIARE